uniref:Class I hydrophobin pri2 n=1 Tax=Cyclocybe aegerita TaxID=1973307 RepID=PRI2_CYCAE|nr:Pri2p [Cyclocybe aegerita]
MVAIKSLAILALPVMAMASPLVPRTDSPSQCNNGSLQCCNSSMTQDRGNLQIAQGVLGGLLGGLLGLGGLLDLVDLNALIGVQCSPISIVGNANTCTQQTVCCSNNNFNGLIALGCTPININL